MAMNDYGKFLDSDDMIDDVYFDPGLHRYGKFETTSGKTITKNVEKIEKAKLRAIKKALKEEKNSRSVNGIHSLSTKMILIISVIIVLSMGTITVLVSKFTGDDVRINAEVNNMTLNQRSANVASEKLKSIVSGAGMFWEMQNNAQSFFERNSEIAAIAYLDENKFFVNRAYFISHEIEMNSFENYVTGENDAVENARNGSVKLLNASPYFNNSLLSIFIPLSRGDTADVCAVLFDSENLGDSFSTGNVNLSMLINDDGTVLVHPDAELMMKGEDVSSHALVKDLKESGQLSKQMTYVDDEGEKFFGAYTKIEGFNAAVVTEVKAGVVLAGVYATTRRNIYITVAILAIVILLVRFFARSISGPIETLTEVTDQISQANFDTPLFDELKTGRRDEIGVLNRSTKDEQRILQTVTSLTNKGVTQAIVKKRIDFEPHLKDITIFFSDIRGFTAISDGFNKRFGEKSAGEIIGFLNDYMGRMVNCIKATGGNVDKFEGDAIMACWGVLRDDDLSFEKMAKTDNRKAFLEAEHEAHRTHDVISAIRSTVGMRYALMKYNKDAQAFTAAHANEPMAKYKPHIKIGCGLNVGRATVGFMGSRDKMEFTSIGDAVNLASRTESSNKPCGTDILITEDTYNLLKKDYIKCPENNFTIPAKHKVDEVVVEQIPVTFDVKGKGRQHFYGVVNMPEFDIEAFFKRTEKDFVLDDDCKKACGPEGPKTLNEVRALLDIPVPDFGGVNLDAEENKVKVS